jgi:radical SAM superfamily enzyme YgiQ (UPF0313 family)
MARLLFFQDVPFESFGVEFLSAYLKSKNHQVDLVVLNQEKKGFDPVKYVKDTKADVVGFSISTIDIGWTTTLAAKLKADAQLKKIVIIYGGSHPTMHPEFIDQEGIDLICVGEGEYSFEQMLNRIEQKNFDFSDIPNFQVKKDGNIFRNPLRQLVDSHDDLPFPDREIYYKYPLLRNMTTKKFFTGRGCAYKCAFCNHEHFQNKFKGLGKYVTYRSPRKVIDEIKDVKTRYGFKYVYLATETLTTNHQWLTEFLELYKNEIRVPFSCMSRPNELNEDIIRKLAEAGCFYTSFGLESGNERIRNQMLKRDVTNEQLINAAQLLHKYKIKFLLHQIMVLPHETIDEAFETIEMDIKLKPHSTWTTIFQPTVGTTMYEYCKDNGLLPEETEKQIDSMYAVSTLKQPFVKELMNLQKLVYLCIKFPPIVPLVRRVIHLPSNPIFEFVNKWNMMKSFRYRYRLGYIEMFLISLKSNKRFG